ncbi:MAG TPA: hypothetical protein VNA12_00900 [Mycobacteriales bacterium]|nr:hypothetical protein [Mycobacteriales bacterium]
MRTASRVFLVLGLFGLVASLLHGSGYLSGDRNVREAVQGVTILAAFAIACVFLAVLLRPQGARELDGLHLPADGHHDGEIHLPGPSIFPALYGVAGLVLFVGLVLHHTVAVVGLVLVVLVTVGWARESVADYRREIAHATDEPTYDERTVAAAHRVQAFARAHHGAEAVVQHLGRQHAEIALVGRDGAWGSVTAHDVAEARTAVALAGVALHESWPAGLGLRIRPDADHWQRMGGAEPWHPPHRVRGPRDGTTQTGAKIFVGIGTFGVCAALLYLTGFIGERVRDGVQGATILGSFAIACFYLFVMLRNARGEADDLPWADEHGVSREPTQPDPPVDLATLHLPGPSLMPALYSVAATLLVLGLVFHHGLALAGLALVVLTTVGWGVESVREYRQTVLGGHGHGAHDPHPDHTANLH